MVIAPGRSSRSMPVLGHLAVGGQRPERPAIQAGQHGVGHVADAGLQRRQGGGQPPASGLMGQEL